MQYPRPPSWLLILSLLLLPGLLWLDGALADRPDSSDLGGPDRYLTHVSTDKPLYRPGEVVRARGILLHALHRTPFLDGSAVALVEILGPRGQRVGGGHASTEDGVIAFTWTVPDQLPGGEYRLRATWPIEGHPPAERTFQVRAYRAPRLRSQIIFLREGYGPGDSVVATLQVSRAEGGHPEGARVTAQARLDGADVYRGETTVDSRGLASVRFPLPAKIARGDGTLALVIEDGGTVETAAKTIPILLRTLDLQLYPEGGELVAGLPCRVYVEARTPARKPADLVGVIQDAAGAEVARLRTLHEGRGVVSLTPVAGEQYHLRILEPTGINTTFPLPAVSASGAVLRATRDRYPRQGDVTLAVATTEAGAYRVALHQREVEVASMAVELAPGRLTVVHLTPPSTVGGVLQATLLTEAGLPVAERLIYREPDRALQVQITADREAYAPGDQVTLTVRTSDQIGEPCGAVVGLEVTDDSVLELIETREQAPRLLPMVLLEPEVRELRDAHVYLDASEARSARALDLLLGTQGWRRLAFYRIQAFEGEHGDQALRVLARRVPVAPQAEWAMRGRGKQGAAERFAEVKEEERLGEEPPAAAPMPAPPADGAIEGLAAVEADGGDKEMGLLVADLEMPEEARQDRKRRPAGRLAGLREALFRDPGDLVVVREYAHVRRPGWTPGERRDFTETVCWQAGLRTDPETGEATVSFALSDAVTSFNVRAGAFDAGGALGQGDLMVESVEPFHLDPKLPLEVTSGDRILVPITLVNGTSSSLAGVAVSATAPGLQPGELQPVDLAPGARERRLLAIDTGTHVGTTELTVTATAGPHADLVQRPLVVQAAGFPVTDSRGGMLPAGGAITLEVTIPDTVVPGSVTCSGALYPSPMASLSGALERLIREPHGCFEQTSSTTYPLIMAQQYFLTHTGVEPAVIQRSHELLAQGYQRLVGFECSARGYEWFGQDPGHETLTAYGLLEFTDMAEVREVDAGMLARTREWLLGMRDGKGGFTRARRALHTWIMDPDCSNAYITWALLSCGETGLEAEVESLTQAAAASTNSYVLALAANVMQLAERRELAGRLCQRLAQQQTEEGWVDGATTSIVGSRGLSLQVETSALAILAWLREPGHEANVERAIRWLAAVCEEGRFGSTQSTVLALRAILAYDAARSGARASGTVRVLVDDHPAGGAIPFTGERQELIAIPDIAEVMTPGTHRVELRMEQGHEMPWSLAFTYHAQRPASSPACPLQLAVELTGSPVVEGEATEARVRVANRSQQAVPTPVAIVGLPGGLEVRHDQLKELVQAGRIAAYEVRGREVVLYWRDLAAGQEVELPISLVAALPGTYQAPASRAYLYYGDEDKHWVAGGTVEITPR